MKSSGGQSRVKEQELWVPKLTVSENKIPQVTSRLDCDTRWFAQVETIVISVISMLSDPTDESPANLDAAVRTCRWL